jgi:hypothetical protein
MLLSDERGLLFRTVDGYGEASSLTQDSPEIAESMESRLETLLPASAFTDPLLPIQ